MQVTITVKDDYNRTEEGWPELRLKFDLSPKSKGEIAGRLSRAISMIAPAVENVVFPSSR